MRGADHARFGGRGSVTLTTAAFATAALALGVFAAATLAPAALATDGSGTAPAHPTTVDSADTRFAAPPGGALAGGTHAFHLSADPQVTSDGTVVLETLFVLRPSYVVLRADDGGEPGEPLGHTAFDTPGFRTDIPVAVDPAVWSSWGDNRTVWAVLHRDDGDGEFDLADDPALTARNTGAKTRLRVRKRATDGDDRSAVRVLAAAFDPRPTDGSSVTVRRVDLARDGHVVVETRLGTHLGSRPLPAGTHRNVSVPVNASRLPDRSRFRVRAVAHRDDGDGAFGPAVRVGGDRVATTFELERATDDGTDEPLVVTPAGTPTPTGTPTVSPTPEPSPTASDTPADTDTPTASSAPDGTTDSGGSGPGFGVVAGAVAAVVLAVAAVVRARRR